MSTETAETAVLPVSTGPEGLTEAEAAARRPQHRPRPPGRSYASIVRANVFTVFNLILATFAAITLAFGDWRDVFFLAILVINVTIGIAQEVRAKRAVERLAALVAPTARVVRDGRERSLGVDDVVPGDLLLLGAGDQVVADGTLRTAASLALDEAVLTGESRPVTREAGDEVRAGAFCSEGSGSYVAEAVGADSYAGHVSGLARSFRHPLSPLQRGMNRLLLAMVAIMIPLGAVLALALWRTSPDLQEAVSTATAAMVTMIPEGLILLASITYAVSTIRMSRRGALAQQLSAIEALASADMVLVDKTGTLTTGDARLVHRDAAGGVDAAALDAALAEYAACWPDRDETIDAIARELPHDPVQPDEVVPFSSRRRWAAVRLGDRVLALGAPGVLNPGPLADVVHRESTQGRRVLVLASGTGPLGEPGPDDPPPGHLRAMGVVALAETLQPDVRGAVEFLGREGIPVHVVSGDAPATVGAIAADCGIHSSSPILASELPTDPTALARVVTGAGIVGRATPDDKERIVGALAAEGFNVAMIGDGVNDVPALKKSRVAIAPGEASQMARAVADIVMVRGGFASLAPMILEGRQALRNLQRVSKLFVAKSFLAAFLILTIGLVPTTYPFLPRHLTLLSLLTIGIPAFFLALAPSTGAWKARDYLGSTFRFALPAGVAAGLGVVSAYLFALNVLFDDVAVARTVAVTALMAIGLWLVLVLEVSGVKRSAWVIVMCMAMAGLYVMVILVAPLRDFFELTTLGALSAVVAIGGAAITASGLWMLDRQFRPEPLRGPLPRWLARFLPESFRADPENTKPGD
ncbi:MAG: cation-translocating P-type ATPase [Acidobacteria bacterium]|nr:cation-translocating P-type ATPase [Acidobacteriota bacterium]